MTAVSFQPSVTAWASTRTVPGVVVLSVTTFSVVRTAEVTSLPASSERSNFSRATRSALPLTGGLTSIPYWVP